MIFITLPIVLLVIFLTLGLFWFAPELRGNLLLWQGRERDARKIFEQMLKRHPEKLNLYKKLARIYCIEGRKDKKAIRVFEVILKLRISFQWEDQIVPVVARHYVNEGRGDSEAIRLIEKAVKIELAKVTTG